MKKATYPGPVCGIDEVGRGPWAGPVVAAAVILPARLPRFFSKVTDSKKLGREQREALFTPLLEYCAVGIGRAEVEEIDTVNILQATFLAMQRAFAELPERPVTALIDGNRMPELTCDTYAIIGGDLKHKSIAAASIIAKVTRDRFMKQLCEEFPGYNWSSNAGYGTKCHQRGLAERGPCIHHRRSFAPIRELLEVA